MNDFVIEKGIPMPMKKRTFPLAQMDVGDSFLASFEMANTLRMAIQRFKIINSQARFATRQDGNGMRVFRIA